MSVLGASRRRAPAVASCQGKTPDVLGFWCKEDPGLGTIWILLKCTWLKCLVHSFRLIWLLKMGGRRVHREESCGFPFFVHS